MSWAVTGFEGAGGDRAVVLKQGGDVTEKSPGLRFHLTFPGERDMGFLPPWG